VWSGVGRMEIARHFAERFETKGIDIVMATLFVLSCPACCLKISDTSVFRKL